MAEVTKSLDNLDLEFSNKFEKLIKIDNDDNLVKYHCVVCEDDKRVINSNELIAEKIKQYMEEQQEENENYADEFSGLLEAQKVEKLLEDKTEVLESAEAEELLEQARQEAQEILDGARQEAEILKNQICANAEKEGFNAGYAKGMNEAEQLKQQALQEKKQQEQDYQQQLDKMEPVLVDALIEVFESVFQIQFAEKKEFIMHLLQGALNKIEGSKDYLIRVSKEDFTFVSEMKSEIQSQLPRNSALEVVEDLTLNKNQCLIETDGGVFDCGLDTQMDSLIRDLRTLSGLQ